MNLDYEDFAQGGGAMSIRRSGTRLPFKWYKHSPEFLENQSKKPQVDSRNPAGTEHRYWELEDKHGNLTGNHVHEVRGRRIYRGACSDCSDVVIAVRDVSGPEFRGKGNPGMRGRWPQLCDNCRVRRREESLQRRAAAKRRADRDRIADKRQMASDDAAPGTAWDERKAAEEAADRARWAREDREAAERYRQRRGGRSPYG